MDGQEFMRLKREICNKEQPLDGNCKHLIRFGAYSKHLMEQSGLIRYAGITGKTRIVIEFDNDTGEGWMRAIAEDPVTPAIHKCQSEHPEHPQNCPTACIRCVEDTHRRQPQ